MRLYKIYASGEQKMSEIVEFDKKIERQYTDQFSDIPSITAILNQPVIISAYRVYDFKNGEATKQVCVIDTDQGKFKTGSDVLIKQLNEDIKPYLDQGKQVKAKIVKVKRYYTFAKP